MHPTTGSKQRRRSIGASSGFSWPKREQKSVCNSEFPHIYIRGVSVVLASIAGIQPDFMRKIVVQPKFGVALICPRERISCDQLRPKELLHPEHRFEPPYCRVRPSELRQPI